MALGLDPNEYRPYRSVEKVRAADIEQRWRVARDGIEVIAHGALICPRCDAPLVIGRALAAWRQLNCGFCGHSAKAREFLTQDVFDTVSNEAYMIARLR